MPTPASNKHIELSLYQKHTQKWAKGCGADICPGARKLCFARGTVPCQVLFVGEAPGNSENLIGRPFIGPAGKLLDHIISRALRDDITYALTNLVLCIPLQEDGDKYGEPPDEAVEKCKPRLQEFVELCEPELIVCVGAQSRDWLDPKYSGTIRFHRHIPQCHIQHPAAVMRLNVAMQGLAVQRCIVTLTHAVEDHVTYDGKQSP